MDPKTPQSKDQNAAQSQYYDPFPQPQTIPSGWDLSTLLSAPDADSVSDSSDSAEGNSVIE